MQKIFIILTLILLTATPAFARNENSQNKSNNSQKESGQSHSPKKNVDSQELEDSENEDNLPEITPAENTTTPIPTIQCNPDQEWKNHGAYVSCVAKSGVGGQKVSEAARSNIGKKGYTTPSITPSISPTITPSVSPTVTPSISPTISPDPEATPSPSITPTGTLEENANSLLFEVISVLESIKSFLETLNPFE